MVLYFLILSVLILSNCIPYIPSETFTKLDSEKGCFFVKASDYYKKGYSSRLYIHFRSTNIMLNNLQYCYYPVVPQNISESYCKIKIFRPYKSNSDSNIINDYYQLNLNNVDDNFIIFYYNGVKLQSNFKIEVNCTNDNGEGKSGTNSYDGRKKLRDIILILIIVSSILGCALIVITICLIIVCKKKKKLEVGQIVPNSEEINDTNNNQYSIMDNYPNN